MKKFPEASVPRFSFGVTRLDRVRQENADTEQRNNRGG
jgi:hypothetical protein